MNTYTVRTWYGAHATQVEATSARDAITQVFGALSTGHRVVDTDEGTFLTYSDDEGTREIAHVTLYLTNGTSPLTARQHQDYVTMVSWMNADTLRYSLRSMLARARDGHPEVLPVARILATRLVNA